MVNLSLGLAYVHYGLKRQSTNRQYLLLQGQAFLMDYAERSRGLPSKAAAAEAYYNIGRLFQLLGIGFLAHEYYARATAEVQRIGGDDIIESSIAMNKMVSFLAVKNRYAAYRVMESGIRL
jgi:general transcription factor 3C polypeptide 3 (transcription factor C subunit 4)